MTSEASKQVHISPQIMKRQAQICSECSLTLLRIGKYNKSAPSYDEVYLPCVMGPPKWAKVDHAQLGNVDGAFQRAILARVTLGPSR